MRRLFWVAFGATAAVVVMHKASRAAHKFTPAGLGESLAEGVSDVGAALRSFVEEFREAMAEREDELRDALGLNGTFVPTARERLYAEDYEDVR